MGSTDAVPFKLMRSLNRVLSETYLSRYPGMWLVGWLQSVPYRRPGVTATFQKRPRTQLKKQNSQLPGPHPGLSGPPPWRASVNVVQSRGRPCPPSPRFEAGLRGHPWRRLVWVARWPSILSFLPRYMPLSTCPDCLVSCGSTSPRCATPVLA